MRADRMRLGGGVWLFIFGVALEAQPASEIPRLEAYARQHLAARDANAALEDYQKLAALNPRSAAYEDEIGFLLAATNRTAGAIPHLQRATQLDAQMAQAWFHLGVALCITQQAAACVHDLRKAVELSPGNGEYRFRLGGGRTTKTESMQRRSQN